MLALVEVPGDRGQTMQVEMPGDRGQGTVGTHPVRAKPVKEWFGASRRVVSGFKWDRVRKIPFDNVIMMESAEDILVKVVNEVKRRRPEVRKIRLGEVWASP